MQARLLRSYVAEVVPKTLKGGSTLLGVLGGPAALGLVVRKAGMSILEASLLSLVLISLSLIVRQYFVWRADTAPLRELPMAHRERMERLKDVAGYVLYHFTLSAEPSPESLEKSLGEMDETLGFLSEYPDLQDEGSSFLMYAQLMRDQDSPDKHDFSTLEDFYKYVTQTSNELLGRE